MSRKFVISLLVAALSALLLATLTAADAPEAPAAESYIIVSSTSRVPRSLLQGVDAAGGQVTNTVDKIGVVVASATDPAFPGRIAGLPGVYAIAPNLQVHAIEPVETVAVTETGNPPTSGDDDFFFDLQWGHDAVDAVEAWDMRGRGAGVRVVVIDDGIDSDHPDLAPNLNVDLSTSFVPGETFEYIENYPGDPFSHGTHVAGTIAAADNGYGTIGVAPEAELVMVKGLSSFTGSGQWDWLLEAIVYAGDIRADVVNMSLGALVDVDEIESVDEALDVLALITSLDRAGRYANNRGATLVASAGNSGVQTGPGSNYFHLPSDIPRYLSISATAPIGWAVDSSTNLDVPAFYTNYGWPSIDYAAPGGSVEYPGNEACTVAGLTRPCYVFDLVFSTGSAGAWYWSGGTSMAAPHVSGVAAIYIGVYGGDLHPLLVRATLNQTADDLGAPGPDIWFGWGRVNAANRLGW